DAWGEVVVVRPIELVRSAEACIANLFKNALARGERRNRADRVQIEIGVQEALILRAMLDSEILPAKAQRERKFVGHSKSIFGKSCQFVVMIMTREARGLERTGNSRVIGVSGHQPLRSERCRKKQDLTRQHAVHVRAFVITVLVGAESMIVAHMEIRSAELEGVLALDPSQAAGFLIHVLRTSNVEAGGKTRVRQVTWKGDLVACGR